MKQLTIVEDTRNKSQKHDLKKQYFSKHGIDVVRSKIYAGDYTLLNSMSVCIDTKQNMQEIYGDMIQDHDRFARECDRAYEHGITLVFVVENTDGITRLDEVHKWRNPRFMIWIKKGKKGRPPVSSKRLQKMMQTFEIHHHTKFYFCSPESSGRAIVYLLTGTDMGV